MAPAQGVGSTKAALGLLACLAVIAIVILSLTRGQSTSATLSFFQTKFKLNFAISPQDQKQFSVFTQKLNLPQSFKDEVEFELDATSQAALAFTLPATSKIKILDHAVSFSGSLKRAPLAPLPAVDLMLPQATNLVVYAADFKQLIKVKLPVPLDLELWLDQNFFTSHGQVMAVFGENADFVFASRAVPVKFEDLQNIKSGNGEPLYKKDQFGEAFDLHLVKIPTSKRQITAAFFQIGQWLFFTSSKEAAEQVIKVQRQDLPGFEFSSPRDSTFILLVINDDQNPLNDNSYHLVLDKESPIPNSLTNVRLLKFILMDEAFSGLINLK